MGLEGILAKRRDRPYRSGRTSDWVKVKNPDARAATTVIEG
jgi:ATP-dependent DNA ligase